MPLILLILLLAMKFLNSEHYPCIFLQTIIQIYMPLIRAVRFLDLVISLIVRLGKEIG